ncbi:hypothetical protein [Thermostichus sp. MS-CIW-39]
MSLTSQCSLYPAEPQTSHPHITSMCPLGKIPSPALEWDQLAWLKPGRRHF